MLAVLGSEGEVDESGGGMVRQFDNSMVESYIGNVMKPSGVLFASLRRSSDECAEIRPKVGRAPISIFL